MAPDFIFFIP
jgi:hypothetical protein